jgi:DeoR/GlpR family transcriptional regulator of sugar metabolism
MLNDRGECTVEEISQAFGVSTMTVRRDLQALADAGRVMRTHGGASAGAQVSFEFRYLDRMQENHKAKEAIGARAAELVKDGESVMLDSGTTTLAIANRLRNRRNLTVVTASLPIASALYGCEGIELLLLGGQLRKDSPDLIGAITESNVDMMKADIAFLGADGIDEEGNVYQASATVAGLLSKMAQPARRVYSVADHTKIGKTALMRFGNIAQWNGLITDDGLTQEQAEKLMQAGVELISVPQRK